MAPLDRPPLEANIRFHLTAPYSRNPADWLRFSWIDRYSGEKFRIRTKNFSDRAGIRVQTHADILDRFRNHPEAKSAGPDGSPSDSRTTGLLGRLNIRVLTVFHIGKETNLLEQQEEGILLADPQAVYLV